MAKRKKNRIKILFVQVYQFASKSRKMHIKSILMGKITENP